METYYEGVTSKKKRKALGNRSWVAQGQKFTVSSQYTIFSFLSAYPLQPGYPQVTFRRESHSFCQDSISTFGPSSCWAGRSPLASTQCLSCRLKDSGLFENSEVRDVALTPDSTMYCRFGGHFGPSEPEPRTICCNAGCATQKLLSLY